MGINLMAFSYWPYKVSTFFQILSLALFDTSSIFPCSKPIKFRDQVRDLWHLSQHAILELLLDFLVLTCIYMSAGGGTHTDIHQKNFIWMWAYMQIFHVYQIPKSLLVISRSHFIHLKVYKYNKYICMIHIYIYICMQRVPFGRGLDVATIAISLLGLLGCLKPEIRRKNNFRFCLARMGDARVTVTGVDGSCES